MAEASLSWHAARDRLVAEQRAAWSAFSSLLRDVRDKYAAGDQGAQLASAQSIGDAVRAYASYAQEMAVAPAEEFERLRPIRRSLNAIEDFDREGEGSSVRRARLDGAMQALLGEGVRALSVPWLLTLQGPGSAPRWASWCERAHRLEKQASTLIQRYEAWARAHGDPPGRPSARAQARHALHLAFWWRRQRSVAAELGFHAAIARAGLDLLRQAESLENSAARERQDLLDAIRAHLDYLDTWDRNSFVPPDIHARILTPEQRSEDWWTRCDDIFERQLPPALDHFLPFWILPSPLDRSRRLHPARVFRDSLHAGAQAAIQTQFNEISRVHVGIAQEIERSEEVIRYAAEASSAGLTNFVPEAVKNATDRLRECLEEESSRGVGLALAVLPALVRAVRETAQSPDARRAFAFTRHAKRQSAALLRRGREDAASQAETAALQFTESAGEAWERFLIRIGWKTPVRIPLPPLIRRPDLWDAFEISSARRDLPALYLRLFRLAPVEDPRFLVGREEELDGFRQALAGWREGRYAACMVVGARGSGKTSLLNCAIPEIFSSENVVRRQFSNRVTSPQSLESELRQIIGGGGNDLTFTLASTRRVVILEEVERVFIKSFGGFAAARRLIEIVQSSASTTLWILVINVHGARLLEEALRWQGYFSHVINSMSVWREDLEQAILQRHNLSGLKLAFAPPRESGLRARLGLQSDPREAFFHALYEQSGGNFRSALELWQSSVVEVEGGAIHMRQPLSPDLAGLRKSLRQEDHFTLLSILQHGSLTAQELAQVLLEPLSSSQLRLDRLTAMGLIKQDPEHPGLRVDPEAQRFVHTLLQSVNLI